MAQKFLFISKPIKMENSKNQGQQDQKKTGMSNTKDKQSGEKKTVTSKRSSDSSSSSDRSSKSNSSR